MSILKNYGLKETKQRLELISLFEKFNSLSIKEITLLIYNSLIITDEPQLGIKPIRATKNGFNNEFFINSF